MSSTLQKQIENEAMRLAPIVVEGYLGSLVAPYAKEALINLYNYAQSNGNYNLKKAPERPQQNQDNDAINIIKRYTTWHIHYSEDESPLSAYLCTQRGLFLISLASGQILQAFPCNAPKLSPSILEIYDVLNGKMSSPPNTTDNDTLEKVKWHCLINMILRDGALLLCHSTKTRKKIDFIKQLVEILDTKAQEETVDFHKINDSIVRLKLNYDAIREALQGCSDKIKTEGGQSMFYKKRDSKCEMDAAYRLGVVFQYQIGKFLLYISREHSKKFITEKFLKTGLWGRVLSMHYDIL